MHIMLYIVAAKEISTLDVISRQHMLLGRKRDCTTHFCRLGYWTHISLCSNPPLQTEVLQTHITNTIADLLQPVQGRILRAALQLVSKCLTDKSLKVKPSHYRSEKKTVQIKVNS